MFTGIIEDIGTVKDLKKENGNLVLTVKSGLAHKLKLNESLAHNGICLSVQPVSKKTYRVTAVRETLNRTTLGNIKKGGKINLERALKANGRIDGHFVLGHIDSRLKCLSVNELSGSHLFTFACRAGDRKYIVEKGSIAINGVSLTIAGISSKGFSVAVIPYTFRHTVFRYLKRGDEVNAEYDVLGKYIIRAMGKKNDANN